MGDGVAIGRAIRAKLGRGRPIFGLIPDDPTELSLERIAERLRPLGCHAHHTTHHDWCSYCRDQPLYVWNDIIEPTLEYALDSQWQERLLTFGFCSVGSDSTDPPFYYSHKRYWLEVSLECDKVSLSVHTEGRCVHSSRVPPAGAYGRALALVNLMQRISYGRA